MMDPMQYSRIFKYMANPGAKYEALLGLSGLSPLFLEEVGYGCREKTRRFLWMLSHPEPHVT